MTTYTPEQQKEHRRLWVEALRSGKYQQAVRTLRMPKTNAMCCLGVACEISGLGEWDGDAYVVGDDRDNGVLPDAVGRWLGLTDRFSSYGGGNHQLTSDNDEGKSFTEIADIIEAEPLGLIAEASR